MSEYEWVSAWVHECVSGAASPPHQPLLLCLHSRLWLPLLPYQVSAASLPKPINNMVKNYISAAFFKVGGVGVRVCVWGRGGGRAGWGPEWCSDECHQQNR